MKKPIKDDVKTWQQFASACVQDDEFGDWCQCFLTPSEHDELEERWKIITLLLQGETQRSVAQKVSVSVTTVNRGAKQLQKLPVGFVNHLRAWVGET